MRAMSPGVASGFTSEVFFSLLSGRLGSDLKLQLLARALHAVLGSHDPGTLFGYDRVVACCLGRDWHETSFISDPQGKQDGTEAGVATCGSVLKCDVPSYQQGVAMLGLAF